MSVAELYAEEVRKIAAIGSDEDMVYLTYPKDLPHEEDEKWQQFMHTKLQHSHSVRVFPLFHVHKAVIGVSISADGGGFKIVKPPEE